MKPMLACSEIPEVEKLNYPVIMSPKLDGIRCIMKDGVAFSRSMKRIPNKFIQQELNKLRLHGLDGELMVEGDFNSVQSAVMSVDGEPDFYYAVFDCWDKPKLPFTQRLCEATARVCNAHSERVRNVNQHTISRAEVAHISLETFISEGYEGAIVRDPDGPYKHGRSTMNQGWMLKLKKFQDDEALVIGFEELMHNDNPEFTGELGQTKRSKDQSGLSPSGMLGALIVSWRGKEFKIGTGRGLTQKMRRDIWENQGDYYKQLATFQYQELSSYGIPRFPSWKGFRSPDDV